MSSLAYNSITDTGAKALGQALPSTNLTHFEYVAASCHHIDIDQPSMCQENSFAISTSPPRLKHNLLTSSGLEAILAGIELSGTIEYAG